MERQSAQSHSGQSTSPSLIARLKLRDTDAWSRLVELYGPLIYYWGRHARLDSEDARDLMQDVLQIVWKSIGRFHHDRQGDTFRGWLWTITRNKINEHRRAGAAKPSVVLSMSEGTGDADSLDMLSHEIAADPLPELAVSHNPLTATETVVQAAGASPTVPELVALDMPSDPGSNASPVGSDLFGVFARDDLLTPIGIADAATDSVITQRGSIRGAKTPGEAVNGLGGDIVRRLETEDLFVVWILDASLSMRSDRIQASRQMSKVLHEIEQRTQQSAYHATHSLCCFGNSLTEIQAPTRSWRQVVRMVPKIPNDMSGKENMLRALCRAITAYRESRSERMLFVIWTDESGDDIDQLEQTIALCRQEKVDVCAVGPAAVLGRRRGAQFFHHADLHPYRGFLPVFSGPDSGVRQIVALPHWFGKPLPAYGGLLPNVLPSGFGPYHLVRLSQATGGSFTLYDRDAILTYKTEALANYLPSYESVSSIREGISQHDLRRAVVEAAGITARAEGIAPPLFDPNDLDEFYYWMKPRDYQQKFGVIVKRDLNNVRRAIPVIESAYRLLASSKTEAAFEEEQSPRWKACYLLARGRLAALSVRHREYEQVAVAILEGRALSPAANKISLRNSHTLLTGDWGKQRSAEAQRYLKQCVSEHPETPWAKLAEWENRYPLGISISQRQTVPSGVDTGGPPARVAGPSI